MAVTGLDARRKHRPSELSGGQQQRVAVARALVSRPTVMFADEPTGNLDSTMSGEILSLLRRSVTDLGQTTVMVTHDAHAAAIADRVLFLADGHIVRDLGPSSAHEILDTLEQVTRAMTKVALKGLLGRKTRAILTSFAIVLGVAMISGTFVLTDTIQKSFDSVFTQAYDKTDASITAKEIVKNSRNRAPVPGVPAGQGPRARRDRSRLGRRQRRGQARRLQGQDRRRRERRGRGLQRRPQAVTLQPAHARVRAAGRPARTRSSSTPIRPPRHHYAVGDTIGAKAEGPVAQYTISGIGKLGGGGFGGLVTVAAFDLHTAQAHLRAPEPVRRDLRRGGEGRLAAGAQAGDPSAGRAVAAGADRRRGGPGGLRRSQQGHRDDSRVPARVRRHLAVRRRVRHLQHHLDHRRAAHP